MIQGRLTLPQTPHFLPFLALEGILHASFRLMEEKAVFAPFNILRMVTGLVLLLV